MTIEWSAAQCADKKVPGYPQCPPDVKARIYGYWGKIKKIVYITNAHDGWLGISYEGGEYSPMQSFDYVVTEEGDRP